MSNLVVLKFGGSSVASTERIGNVAKRVQRHIKERSERPVVVVSAMSGETDRLLDLCRRVSADTSDSREVDQVLASGEQVSCALTALALQRLGVPAVSLLAHQVPIRTHERFGQHLIEEVDPTLMWSLVNRGVVPVVAGFQGVDAEGNFRTLGRGGSDNTAVALAAALDRSRCIIYTDVDGVYTALPSIVKQARKLKHLTYEEMLELAGSGAKVLQSRSVSLARKQRVPLVVASSFADEDGFRSGDFGTAIVEEYAGMEDAVVSGITCRNDETKLTIRNLPDVPGITGRVFQALGDSEVLVDMIVQTQGVGGKTAVSFTIPSSELGRAQESLMELLRTEMPEASLDYDKNMAKLSVVGEGMRNHSGVAAQVFRVLGKEGINVDMITTSEIAITVAIHQRYSELAVRALHEAFIEGQEVK